MKRIIFYMTVLFASTQIWAQSVTINESVGWLESAFVKWTPVSGANSYNVYYTGGGQTNKKIDTQLIRSYGTYFRADLPGLAAGSYTLKVVPVINGSENTSAASTTASLTVKLHVREGFAFFDNVIPGAYNADGTPKNGAKIIYITAATANTVTCDVLNDKGIAVSTAGLMNILAARGKGYDKTPLIIRMIGLVKESQITGLQGGNFIAFTGANTTDRKIENITFEGIGDDATASGYGFFTKRSNSIEIRNLGIMLFGDDGVSMEADNSHIWVHNNDFFYGKPGSDADQVKGDGSIDMKYNTSYITVSFNHFWDSGKSTFAGGATESNTIYFTYHHNWFDHSDSRHPRLSHSTVHVYNNYYDGNAGMGLLNTGLTSAFVEANYYRNCPYPMMINMQGTNFEIWPDGEQNGGMTKAYNNKMEGVKKLIYQTVRATDFDAYLVSSRNEQIPSTVKSRKGGNTYSNFDTASTMYNYTPDSPDNVQSIVTTYAGRIKGGDFKWVFNNSVDDASHDINAPLKNALTSYTTKLVSVQDESNPPVSNQTLTSTSNNNQTVTSGITISSIVFTWGGDATDASVTGLPVSGISFVKNATAKTITITGTPTATVSYSIATTGTGGTPATGSGTITVTPIAPAGDQIHNFTTSGKTSTFYTIAGDLSTSYGTVVYNGLTLTQCIKMGSGTNISYTTTQPSTLTLVFVEPAGTAKVDGIVYTAVGGIITINNFPVGNHTIVKQNTANLFYVSTKYNTTLRIAQTTKLQSSEVAELMLYPNPVTNILYLSCYNQKIEKIAIYTLTGTLVKSSENNTESIDVSDLRTGGYLVKVNTDQGTILNKIIIKK